jgi:hypothetical protein
MNARFSRRHATIVRLKDALPMKAFGIDMKVLLSTEDRRRHLHCLGVAQAR